METQNAKARAQYRELVRQAQFAGDGTYAERLGGIWKLFVATRDTSYVDRLPCPPSLTVPYPLLLRPTARGAPCLCCVVLGGLELAGGFAVPRATEKREKSTKGLRLRVVEWFVLVLPSLGCQPATSLSLAPQEKARAARRA